MLPKNKLDFRLMLRLKTERIIYFINEKTERMFSAFN